MRRPSFVLTALAAAALALAPALADARPGGGASSGSRGGRTYSAPPTTNTAPYQARQFDRTATEPSRGGALGAQQAQRPPIGQPNPAGGFFSRSPFMAGLMGGLIGVGLGGLLFGHGLFGGFTGMASFLGLLLQIGLIAGLVWLVMGFLRRRSAPQPAMAGGVPNGMARQAHGAPGYNGSRGGGAGAVGGAGGAVSLSPADFEAFERTLKEVNAAWSRQDLPALQRLSTPEMAGYFARDLSDLTNRGWRNETRDVKLEQGDLAEAWREGAREYATVAMRFSLVDVTRSLSDGAVVEGDPNRRREAVELWTFVRTQGSPWLLSAIQQTAMA
jgi:predicted lipid-binding transport protein (Tim44 family)